MFCTPFTVDKLSLLHHSLVIVQGFLLPEVFYITWGVTDGKHERRCLCFQRYKPAGAPAGCAPMLYNKSGKFVVARPRPSYGTTQPVGTYGAPPAHHAQAPLRPAPANAPIGYAPAPAYVVPVSYAPALPVVNSSILAWMLLPILSLVWALCVTSVMDMDILFPIDGVNSTWGRLIWVHALCPLGGWACVPPPSTLVRSIPPPLPSLLPAHLLPPHPSFHLPPVKQARGASPVHQASSHSLVAAQFGCILSQLRSSSAQLRIRFRSG